MRAYVLMPQFPASPSSLKRGSHYLLFFLTKHYLLLLCSRSPIPVHPSWSTCLPALGTHHQRYIALLLLPGAGCS